jgi:hypothetical protein
LVIAEHDAGKLTPGTLSTINAASQLKGEVCLLQKLFCFFLFVFSSLSSSLLGFLSFSQDFCVSHG